MSAGDAEARGGRRASASPASGGRCGRRGECGSVTAESMVVLPVVVAVVLGLLWVMSVAVAQVRVVDAAREAARLAARGESASEAAAAARRVAPEGARVVVGGGAGERTAVVSVRVTGPGGLFRALPGLTVRAAATAIEEPS